MNQRTLKNAWWLFRGFFILKLKIMKTNVLMVRKIAGLEFNQRSDNGMFNASELLKQWNIREKQKKQINHFLENKSTIEFLNALEEDRKNHVRNSEDGVNIDVMIIKSKVTSKGRTPEVVFMSPLLFIDFAMWINPKFKVQVLKFVYDELIKNRHTAGDNYKMLSSAGVKLQGYNFKEVATALNWIVFNKNGKDLRQSATQEQLQEISEIESKLAYSIDMGYIKSYDHLIKEMRKLWNKKYAKF